MSDEPQEWLKTEQVARLLQVNRATVTRWIRLGQLRAVRTPGGTYRIPRRDVERLIREGLGD
jgi:excisionase family DNA binding protein